MRLTYLAVGSVMWLGAGMVLGGNLADSMASPVYSTLLGLLLIVTALGLAVLFIFRPGEEDQD